MSRPGIETLKAIMLPEGLDHNRPLMEKNILWMINNMDKHSELIKSNDPVTLFFCDEVCRELLYRGTGLEPMDFMSEPNKERVLNPNAQVIREIEVMGMKVDIINSHMAIGWKVSHPFSGYVTTLLWPLTREGLAGL